MVDITTLTNEQLTEKYMQIEMELEHTIKEMKRRGIDSLAIIE